MSGEPRGERLQIMLTKEELTAVDTWRFGRRMPSRAAAVRELLRRGLAAEGPQDAVLRGRGAGGRCVSARDFHTAAAAGVSAESDAGGIGPRGELDAEGESGSQSVVREGDP